MLNTAKLRYLGAFALVVASPAGLSAADAPLPPLPQRFAAADVAEVPNFQRHVVPLLGQLGCNGRACHGSFQGQGGFRLSLFGYDFKTDHEALLATQDEMRVDVENPGESLILIKPMDEHEHEGGQRYEKGSWQHHVLRRWIEANAPFEQADVQQLSKLEVTPAEVLFKSDGQSVPLKVVAVWDDGTHEDVTPLCRFQSNDEQRATVRADGLVTAGAPGDTHIVVMYDNGVVPIPVLRPVSKLTGRRYPKTPAPTRIDQLVLQKLKKLGIVPAERCNDETFLRRVSLDICGTLPTPAEIERFLADNSPRKRQQKIEELLKRPAYAAWWTTRLCDITGNNADALRNAHPIRGQASREWYDWIYRRVADNVAYDELVAGIVLATSRASGESYLDYASRMSVMYHGESDAEFADLPSMPHYWARADVRKPEERAISFAHAFLGIRIQCAQCHKHPFDQWSKDDFEQFTQFFSGVVASNQAADKDGKADYRQLIENLGVENLRGGELRKTFPAMLEDGKTVPFPEVVARRTRIAKRRPANTKNKQQDVTHSEARLLGSDSVALDAYEDLRTPLMAWLRDMENPYFARALVNRVWSNYFNVGIVQPPDDLSLANPPSNGPLLDYLTRGFVDNGFDLKWLHREITNSRTYQLSWHPNDTNRHDRTNFSRAVPRRLPAEVVYDAIAVATATDDKASRASSEMDGRAIAVSGASYRGNKQRGPSYALGVFGRSTRDSNCDCDRTNEPSLMQTVYLQNDQEMLSMLDRKNEGWLNQIAGQYGLTANNRPLPDRTARIAGMKRRIQQLRQAGDDDRADRLAADVRRRRRQPTGNGDAADRRSGRHGAAAQAGDKPPLAAAEADDIARQAYLRTLSRLPSENERKRARQFVLESESPMEGVRGLLWALLNTKEFIVNH